MKRKEVCVAVSATLAAVGKKLLTALLGNKKGRKALGYTVCIVLFLILLPVITVYGLFGRMAGAAEDLINADAVYAQMPAEYREMVEEHRPVLDRIEAVFRDNGLTDKDISMAKTIYISCLQGWEKEDRFCQRYADCFLAQSGEQDLFQNISSAFGVIFTDADKEAFYQLYGGNL